MSKKPVSERDALLRDLRGALKNVREVHWTTFDGKCLYCAGTASVRHLPSCPRVAIPAAIRWIGQNTFIEFEEVFTIPPRPQVMKVTMALSQPSEPPPFVMSADPMPTP